MDFESCPHCDGAVHHEWHGPNLAGAWCIECGAGRETIWHGEDVEIATGWRLPEDPGFQSIYDLTPADIERVAAQRKTMAESFERSQRRNRLIDEALF